MVVLINPYAIGHAQWVVLGKDSRTTVAFLIGIVPIALIALKGQVELTSLHFCFLQTEEVSIQLTESVAKPLSFTRPQAVHIPTYQFHIYS